MRFGRVRPARWSQWLVWPLAGALMGITTFVAIVFIGSVILKAPDLDASRVVLEAFLTVVYLGLFLQPVVAVLGGSFGLVAAAVWSVLRFWKRGRLRQRLSGAVCTAILTGSVALVVERAWENDYGGPFQGATADTAWWIVTPLAIALMFGVLASLLVAYLERPPHSAASGDGMLR